MHPHIDGQLILNKGDKNIQQRKNSLFSKWFWENQMAARKLMKLEHCLTPSAGINSKWPKCLTRGQDTRKLLDENVGKHSLTETVPAFS